MVLHTHGRALRGQLSCAGSAGSQLVSLGGSGAPIRKALGVAGKE